MAVKQVVQGRGNPAVLTHPLAQIDCLTVQMERDGAAWVTYVGELDNISTFADTQEEALDETKDLVLGYLDSAEATWKMGDRQHCPRASLGTV
jgi:hypothetical protein